MANKQLFGRLGTHLSASYPDCWCPSCAPSKLQYEKERRMNMLATFTRAVSEFYSQDSTKPGVIVSWLPGENKHYVAVHRYFTSGGRQKEVIVSTKNSDLDTAINDAARQFLSIVGNPQTDIARLRNQVRSA